MAKKSAPVAGAEKKKNSDKKPKKKTDKGDKDVTKKSKGQKEALSKASAAAAAASAAKAETSATATSSSGFTVGLLSSALLGGAGAAAGDSNNSKLLEIFSSSEEKSKKAWNDIKQTQKNLLNVMKQQPKWDKEAEEEEKAKDSDEEYEETKKEMKKEMLKSKQGFTDKKRKRDSDDESDSSDDEADDNIEVSGDELADLDELLSDAEEIEDEDDEKEDKKEEKNKKEKKEKNDGKDSKKADEDLAKELSEKNWRTIFVGNVPINAQKKDLKKFFKPYIADCKGTIESVRFRSVPLMSAHAPRKYAVAQGKFHPMRDSMNAYVVFDSKFTARKACTANGKELNGKHLRVDMATKTAFNEKNTVFVGGLPFGVEDEAVRSHFEACGEIVGIRLIRDKVTNIGKGVGYVSFKHFAGVKRAVEQLNLSILDEQKIRVQVYSQKKINKSHKKKKAKIEEQKPVERNKKDKSRWRDRPLDSIPEKERRKWEGRQTTKEDSNAEALDKLKAKLKRKELQLKHNANPKPKKSNTSRKEKKNKKVKRIEKKYPANE